VNTISRNEDSKRAIFEHFKALAVKRGTVEDYSHRAVYFSAFRMPLTMAPILTATSARCSL